MSDRKYLSTHTLSWNCFEAFIADLVEKIRSSNVEISNIYGVPRGGLVIAVRLSHLLGKPLIMSWLSHDEHTLIVDDVVDTGKTLASPACACYNIATLFYCPSASFEPKFWARKKTETTWVVFPWESQELRKSGC